MRFKYFLFLLLGFHHLSSLGGGVALARDVVFVFEAGNYVKLARLSSLAAKDLRYASKVENIHGLLELAERENRIDPIQMLQLSRPFAQTPMGDRLLLVCLQRVKCQPERFLVITQTSKLHAEVVMRNPELGLVQTHHLVGALNENLMIRYFVHSGWTRVEGQVGRTGFDGLFIKLENGVIKEVLIVESKYNTSALQETNFGTQMSSDWVRRKLVELKERYPDEVIYTKITPFIESDAYRAVLWNMKVEPDGLKIALNKVHSKGATVEILSAADTDIASLSESFTNSFIFKAPRNDFEKQVLRWYDEELAAVAKNAPK